MDDNPYIKPFVARLITLREEKGMKARELSKLLGQAHGYMNGLESGRNFPTMLNFHYICDALGVTPSEFFEYTINTPVLDRELYEEIQKLDKVSKEYFLKLIRETNKRPK